MPEKSATRVLVTGASGFIATHVVQQLQREGYMVRGTVRSKSDEQKVKPLLSLCPGAQHKLELVEADLMKPDGWNEAVADCTYVLHTASPLPSGEPEDENEVIQPAVEGTRRVLQACKEAKCVKRVVLTSSIAAISGLFAGGDIKLFTEEDWTDVDVYKQAYTKSKTLQEKAAWEFVKELPEEEKFELAVVNPSYVQGPVLCSAIPTSSEVVKRLMNEEIPVVPHFNFPIVDVRDVAACHLSAMTVPEAANHRHIIDAGHNLWFKDFARILSKEFKEQGYKVPKSQAPDAMLKVRAVFDKPLKMLLPNLGKVTKVDNTRMKTVLGVEPRPVQETVLDMAYSMIENGSIKKTKKYQPRESATAVNGSAEN